MEFLKSRCHIVVIYFTGAKKFRNSANLDFAAACSTGLEIPFVIIDTRAIQPLIGLDFVSSCDTRLRIS